MAKKSIILFLVVLFLIGGAACSSEDNGDKDTGAGENNIPAEERKNEETLEPEPEVYNPLTGKYIEELHKPAAVMIDNLQLARPQHGIERADVVYEAEVEGNITRLMAIFYGENPEKVGPVRSARPYYLELVRPWNIHYVHVGGSMEAYAELSRLNLKNFDNMKGGMGFFTDSSRSAPHNTYFKLEEVMRHAATDINLPGWDFAEDKEINVEYSSIQFEYNDYNKPRYEWESEKDKYFRYINEKPHIDKLTGKQVSVSNIIIQRASHIYTGDKFDHIKINLSGQGEAEYFLGGRYETGYWESAPGGHIKYFDENGSPIELTPGKTWIQIVRPGTQINKL